MTRDATFIVDAHTHAFPPEIVGSRDTYVAQDYWFGELYRHPSAKLTTERELLESMDQTGIDFSIICGFPWGDPGLCREHNAWMAEVCRQHPDRLAYLAIVVPQDDDAARDAERAFEAGALGIGELNADAQGFALTDPASVSGLMEACRAYEKPVMLHASELLGHYYAGKGTATPDRFVHWLGIYPSQPVVLAHWGGGLPFYELMPEVHEVTRNVYYDTAATTYLYRFDVFPVVLSLVGQDRVLFASDFPVLGQKRLTRRVVNRLGDTPEFENLVGLNATNVYHLNGARP